MARPLKYRDLFKILKKYDIRLVYGGRHPSLVRGAPPRAAFPIPYKGKAGDDIQGVYIKAIRRHFNLTPEDGISDDDFYKL